jgi:hypothetical protein
LSSALPTSSFFVNGSPFIARCRTSIGMA